MSSFRRSFQLRPRSQLSYESALAYRMSLVSHPLTSSHRLIDIGQSVYRFMATPSGGDCGFYAIAWALNQGRKAYAFFSPTQIRRALSAQVLQNRHFYETQVTAKYLENSHDDACESVSKFSRNILQEGRTGHWLGQMWGDLELLVVARTFNCRIQLYTFDTNGQIVRPYASFNEGKKSIAIFFSGCADAGHFDALLHHNPWWRRHFYPFFPAITNWLTMVHRTWINKTTVCTKPHISSSHCQAC